MKLPSYPRTKPSGVEWLGDVPEHWQVMKLHHMVRMKSGSAITSVEMDDDGDYPVFGGNGVRGKFPDFTHEGDYVLIGRQGAECGNINYAHGKFWASEHAVVAMPDRKLEYRWLGETLRAMNLNQYSQAAAQPGLSVEVIGRLKLPFPPLAEQQRIAAFLDWKTGQIDALIARKKELLEKLKEKRIAVITRAVTQGLNPAAPMRDSGIPWLGQVPQHWEVPALKFRYHVELGKMLDEKRITGEHSVSYLRNVDVQWDKINYEDLPVMDITPEEFPRYTICEGDVLVCEGGEVGRSAVVGAQFEVIGFQKAIHRLRADSSDELPRFVYYTLLWAANTGVFSVEGASTIAHLTADQLRRYRFPQPPRTEQAAIVAHLDEKVGQMDKMAEKIDAAIDRFTEYRTALITAATTGKIDVHNVKVPAPAQP
jgi:type I restriction enzyme S subunit